MDHMEGGGLPVRSRVDWAVTVFLLATLVLYSPGLYSYMEDLIHLERCCPIELCFSTPAF